MLVVEPGQWAVLKARGALAVGRIEAADTLSVTVRAVVWINGRRGLHAQESTHDRSELLATAATHMEAQAAKARLADGQGDA
jgi:hypothetical protein